jgi:HK97 family phage major capsid protein
MEEIGTNHITEETGEDLADDINLAMGLVESANYGPNGCLSLRSLKARLRGLRATGGEPIFQPAMTQDSTDMIYGLNTAFYTDVASWDQAVTCIVGDWNQVYYSVVQGISYKILDQATLTTVTDGSGNPMALAELDMIALRATMFTGFLPVKADEALAAVVTSGFGDTY